MAVSVWGVPGGRAVRVCLLLCILAAAGCTKIDVGALGAPPDAGTGGARGGDGDSTGGGDGDGDGDGTGDGDGKLPDPACTRSDDPACPVRCPERCNGQDDDCDGAIDEDTAASDCAVDFGTGQCVGGLCTLSDCDADHADCNGVIGDGCEVDLTAAPEHCGSCDLACAFDNAVAACIDGTCEPAGCVDPYLDCDDDPLDCERFGETTTDCGACGAGCAASNNASPGCMDGACVVDACLGNYGDCNDQYDDGCELLLVLDDNCGACGRTCTDPGGAARCSSGVCVTDSCNDGYADCDGSLITPCEPLTTNANCGACGSRCAVDAVQHASAAHCDAGSCIATCESLWGDCNGGDDGCETPLTTIGNCGGCGNQCAPPQASGDCSSGTCEVGQCMAGWADCDGMADNGCETNTNRPDSCGGCDNQCAPMVGCAMGVCMGISCPEERANCDGMDTCDADLASDATCGACNVQCSFDGGVDGHGSVACNATNATPGEKAWACIPTCDAGWADCDGDYHNGCETDLHSLDDCGTCDSVCSKAHATPSCDDGTCHVGSCDTDWGDCDGDGQSCETRLDTANHCGTCGNACDLENADALCGGSPGGRLCQIAACVPVEYASCDGMDGNGCEVNTESDPTHCNGCGNDCTAEPQVDDASCVNSGCVFDCSPGYADCNAADGCETDIRLPATCGGCNTNCASLPDVAGAGCDAGGATPVCTIASCQPGYGDCDGAVGNGCETDVLQSATNCGACGGDPGHNPCTGLAGVATSHCGGGSCVIDACSGSLEDCNGLSADGCEWDPAVDGPCCDAMADADGDGINDCDDVCPGEPDNDYDADGRGACTDACPYDPTDTSPAACFQFPIDNVTQGDIDINAGSDATLDCGGTIDVVTTAGNVSITGWCGPAPATAEITQASGPGALVLIVADLDLNANTTLRATGDRPLLVVAKGSVNIAGTIDASASGSTPGAGGDWSCGNSRGHDGTGSNGEGSGGGGGGFGSAGGRGGAGEGSPGNGGVTRGNASLSPLFGGCGGGKGGSGVCDNTPGAGGGALQISASGTLTVTGTINVAGGQGAKGCSGGDNESGGAGGGSGGAILLQGATVNAGGTRNANGGRGGDSREGNYGGAGSTSPGSNGSQGKNDAADGGGGGGGGYGRITIDEAG